MQFFLQKLLYINIGEIWFILEDNSMTAIKAIGSDPYAKAKYEDTDSGVQGGGKVAFLPPINFGNSHGGQNQAAVLGYNTDPNGGLNALA